MSHYKDTLNLPKTEFPMKANLANQEPAMLSHWKEIKLYEKIREARKSCEEFILYDGPPYANGEIHIGHALNKTLKDIVIKSRLLSGFNVSTTPNWDCHGLPVELNVEKKIGKPGDKVTHKEFRAQCRHYALSQVNVQKEAFARLGILMDWEHPVLTMDFHYEANIVRSLKKILENGCLHQGYKPVYWCVDCGSALAEAEVEYQSKRSLAIDVRFTVVDEAALLSRCHHTPEAKGVGPISIAVWTTTPWTLPANQAVAINPELDYVLLQCSREHGVERLLVAQPLVKEVMLRYGISAYHVAAYCLGKELENIIVQHPFYDRQVPVILGAHVDAESGTGAVHTAPAHGVEDFLVGQHYHLPVDNPVNAQGVFHAEVPLVGGQHVNQANRTIVDMLIQQDKLLHEVAIEHSFPHCWRHKTPLIFRATPQWFISMEQQQLRARALDEIKQVQWIPAWGEARINGMVANRPDWCVSRQRTWCVPMCLILHKETHELHPRMAELMEIIAGKIDKHGMDAWHDLALTDLIGNDARHYEKSLDGLDVWFDSGVMHACLEKHARGTAFPADLCLEGSDQHRGWFNSLLLTAVAMRNKAPYKTVLTHGFTVDASGRKMSKSLGNVVNPEKVVKTLGADVLRLWVASTDYTTEITVSDEILKRTADSYRRLRNTARFLLANLDDFDPATQLLSTEKLLSLDRWAVDRAWQLQQEIIAAYGSYQFHIIYQKLHNFCVVDMGGFYLDIIKDRQYTMQKTSIARLSAQTAIFHILEGLVRWFAPILTFTAEEIWQHLPGKRAQSVCMATWYEGLAPFAHNEPMNRDFWGPISAVRDEVNKVIEAEKSAGRVNSALESEITLYAEEPLKHKLDQLKEELRFVLITSKTYVKALHENKGDAKTTGIQGLLIGVKTSSHPKCERCWQRRDDIGCDQRHPSICERCINNIDSKGEARFYA